MKHIVSHLGESDPQDGGITGECVSPYVSPRELEQGMSHAPQVEAALGQESRVVMHSDPYSMEADKFRMLRVYLRAMAKTGNLKVLMVTSAVMGEGKSVSSLNLALGMAERGGGTVILVEADLRNPSLVSRLGLKSWPGLCQCVEDGSDPVTALRRVNPMGIYLLPAGQITGNPIQMLNSDRFAKIIQRLRYVADWVILDCPPVIPVPDVLALRANVDGCLWVVRADATPRELVKEAMQQIGRDLVLGVILNQVTAVERAYSHYYHYEPLRMLGSGS